MKTGRGFCTTLAIFLVAPLLTSYAADRRYVGSERCRPCHEKAYAVWSSSTHAKAQERLDANRKADVQCLFCHATDVQRNLRAYRLANVQCEACHGPGEAHIRLARRVTSETGKPGGLETADERRCRDCHATVRSPSLRPFDFVRAREAIRHW